MAAINIPWFYRQRAREGEGAKEERGGEKPVSRVSSSPCARLSSCVFAL